jgi:hypothetical protein
MPVNEMEYEHLRSYLDMLDKTIRSASEKRREVVKEMLSRYERLREVQVPQA